MEDAAQTAARAVAAKGVKLVMDGGGPRWRRRFVIGGMGLWGMRVWWMRIRVLFVRCWLAGVLSTGRIRLTLLIVFLLVITGLKCMMGAVARWSLFMGVV